MPIAHGLRLERAREPSRRESLERINEELAPVGARIWPRDWSGLAGDLKTFLADPDPSPARVAEDHP